MRPETIEKALEFVQEELNIMYLQQRNDVTKPHSAPKLNKSFNMPVGYKPPTMHAMPFNGASRTPLAKWPAPVGLRGLQPQPQPFKFSTAFEVTNVHGIKKNDYSVTLPCFNEFNECDAIKLFIYRFHDYFGGLIGLDLSSKWEAKIDLKDYKLITRTATNQIKVYNSRNVNLYEDIIPANNSKLVRIPIIAPDGDVLVNEQTFCNCTSV